MLSRGEALLIFLYLKMASCSLYIKQRGRPRTHALRISHAVMLPGIDASVNLLICRTRYGRGGGVAGWSLARKVVSRGANLAASFLLGATTSDLTGAYRLYRRTVLKQLLSRTTSKGYAFQMEVVVRAQYSGYRIEEVPIVFVDRLLGSSKLGPSEFYLFLKGLLRLLLTL